MALISFVKLSFRRRRALFVLGVTISAIILLTRGGSWFLASSNSRDQLVHYFGSTPKIDEIYGLLHLVVSGDEHHWTNAVGADRPVSLSVYADGKEVDWQSEVQRLNTDHPIVIFGERFCPYTRRVKKVFSAYEITPPPYLIEVDTRADSSFVNTVLSRLTQRATLPNVLVQGNSIGGGDEIWALHKSERLEKVLQDGGTVVDHKGELNDDFLFPSVD